MDRSKLKREYKETKHKMGVYVIKSSADRIAYLGSGVDIQARINRHRTELRFGSHRNKELQERWNEDGESSFQFEVLDQLKQKDGEKGDPSRDLQVLLEMWIHKLEEEGQQVLKL